MLFSNLYNILGVLLVLTLLKYSLANSGLNSFSYVFLFCCLSFCFFEKTFVFLPIPFYFAQSVFQSFFVPLKGLFINSFSFCENQKENQLVLAIKEKEKEKEIASNSKSSDHGQDTFSCYTPLEEIQKYHHWAVFLMSLVSIYISNQAVLAVLRRLKFTEQWVKGMIEKGWPKWCFFWLRSHKGGQLNEGALFNLMICILIVNLSLLYIIVSML